MVYNNNGKDYVAPIFLLIINSLMLWLAVVNNILFSSMLLKVLIVLINICILVAVARLPSWSDSILRICSTICWLSALIFIMVSSLDVWFFFGFVGNLGLIVSIIAVVAWCYLGAFFRRRLSARHADLGNGH